MLRKPKLLVRALISRPTLFKCARNVLISKSNEQKYSLEKKLFFLLLKLHRSRCHHFKFNGKMMSCCLHNVKFYYNPKLFRWWLRFSCHAHQQDWNIENTLKCMPFLSMRKSVTIS